MKRISGKMRNIVVLFVCIMCFSTGCSGDAAQGLSKGNSGSKLQPDMEKLMQFTDYTVGENRCDFQYFEEEQEDSYDGWKLVYLQENDRHFVNIKDQRVVDCFVWAFGMDSMRSGETSSSKDGFAYDIEDHAARIYFDYDGEDGHLTLIEYDTEKDEYIARIDDEERYLSDEFLDFLEGYQLAEIIKSDIRQFEQSLEQNELSVEKVTKLDYDDIVSVYPDSKVQAEKRDDQADAEDDPERKPEQEPKSQAGIYELGTGVACRAGSDDIVLTVHEVKEFVRGENTSEGDSGQKVLYIGYSIENTTDRDFNVFYRLNLTVYGDGKSLETMDYIDKLAIEKEIATYHLNAESGAEKLRPDTKDDYCKFIRMDADEYDLIELVIDDDDKHVLVLRNGNQSCIEALGNTSSGDVTQDMDEERSRLEENGPEYILPDSDTVRLTEADVEGLGLQEINYAKNEIYARHGRKFLSAELNAYFNSRSWYVGIIDPSDFDESILSQVEKDNIRFLNDMEYRLDPDGYQLDK